MTFDRDDRHVFFGIACGAVAVCATEGCGWRDWTFSILLFVTTLAWAKLAPTPKD